MKLRQWIAALAVLPVLVTGWTASAAGRVLYDEESGIALEELLKEDEAAWPAAADVPRMSFRYAYSLLMAALLR